MRYFIRRTLRRRKLLLTILLIAISSYVLSSVLIFNAFIGILTDRFHEETTKFVVSPLKDPWIQEQKRINVTYYFLTDNSDYHFEFRYEFNANIEQNGHRLMIFTCGRGRTCTDYWRFSVGRRIVNAMRKAGFSLLAICSKRRLYETEVFVPFNDDVKWIYKCLQRWINRIYFQRFQRYPLLYIHGVSRGAAFAPSLARVLPIQALILTVYPSNKNASTTHSLYSTDMQNRLSLDPTFANWFYFDYCYNRTLATNKNWTLCPFETNLPYFYPVPPTFFVALDSDPAVPLTRYTRLINLIQHDSLKLGGKLLNHTDAIMMDVLSPDKVDETYMQKHFDIWNNKPYASRIFFEHLIDQRVLTEGYATEGTCRCSRVNFTYWEGFPSITSAWSLQKQAEWKDFLSDIKNFHSMFCEELCGNILAYHGIVSRNIKKALDWVIKMDSLRRKERIKEYLSRPLRIWTYRKQSILNGIKNFSSYGIDWTSIDRKYHMYAVEYLIQDYFTRLNTYHSLSHNIFVWAEDPLLADYFIVPHDLMFLYFRTRPDNLNQTSQDDLRKTLNKVYFEGFMANLRNRFPFWTMAESVQKMGSNHIFTFVGSTNMGFLHKKYKAILNNVIQLVFTGIRPDLTPAEFASPFQLRNTTVTYRHGYDIILPQYTNLGTNLSLLSHKNISQKEKKYLFYFSGTLNHTMTRLSARVRLAYLSKNRSTTIQNQTYKTYMIGNGRVKRNDYIQAMLSSVFALSPEGLVSWSPRIYEAIYLGIVPLILADNIVLPFERFIDWRSFTVKINVSNIHHLFTRFVAVTDFQRYIEEKLNNASSYLHAFRWPYHTIVLVDKHSKEIFELDTDLNSTISSVFHYLGLEMRCRRLEQLYGLEADVMLTKSKRAQQQACTNHPSLCPCHDQSIPLAFHEYI